MRSRFFLLSLLFVPASLLEAQENVDLSVIHRIKEEAFQRSQVMDNLFYLTDVHGPRLSFSPGYAAAADWA
ncbi:MAG TPA: peptidase M28, partial [Vicinamibacteria bacterium]|nr:peptidase M28 [Vicinamibacteria bacterium]